MKKNWGIAVILLLFMVLLGVSMVVEYIHLSVTLQIVLWLAGGLLFGFILPIVHGYTRTFPGLMFYVVIANIVIQVGNGLFSGWTLFRFAEIVILFAAPMLGWFIWDKVGRPGGKEMDIDA